MYILLDLKALRKEVDQEQEITEPDQKEEAPPENTQPQLESESKTEPKTEDTAQEAGSVTEM